MGSDQSAVQSFVYCRATEILSKAIYQSKGGTTFCDDVADMGVKGEFGVKKYAKVLYL